MPFEFKLPDVGEGVAEGEVLKWHVKEGDEVKENQPLVEIMTDKVNVEIPSPRKGTILRLAAKEGQVVKVGQVLVVIGEKGEVATSQQSVPAPVPQQKVETVQAARPTQITAPRPSEIVATPATRKLARELGVDTSLVPPTGTGGRVMDEDVRAFAELKLKVPQAPTPVAAPAMVHGVREERIPFMGLRRKIAEHMAKSRRTAAHFTIVDECDATELVSLRAKEKELAEKRGTKLTYLPFFIKAVIPGLKQYPYMNSSLDEEKQEIVLKKYYNIGIATATERGLIVPVVKDADKKSVFQLAQEISALAEKARAGTLELSDVQDSTFTITSLGAGGGIMGTPIINYPEVAILGLHKIAKRPAVRDGQVVVRDMMNLSLSFDHRVVDGSVAADFAQMVIKFIEDPKLLLLETA